MAKKHEANHLLMLFTNIADAARIAVVSNAMKDYKEKQSVLDPSPTEYLLTKLLGVDSSWVCFFDAVFSGKLNGAMLIGAEDHPAVILAQAMIVQKYGFIQHPLMNISTPIHPISKNKIDLLCKK